MVAQKVQKKGISLQVTEQEIVQLVMVLIIDSEAVILRGVKLIIICSMTLSMAILCLNNIFFQIYNRALFLYISNSF